MSPTIVFTGGGSAGHVTPNIALILALREEGWQVHYIGSAQGIEQGMMENLAVPFHPVSSGKLRRYFSLKNLWDPFRIILGIFQSLVLLFRLKPDVVFSKGGFVAFPVVIGAWLNRIPVVAHESDMSPGLANRLCFPFVNMICLTFAAGKDHFKNQEKIVVTGTPIREQLFTGNRAKGLALCRFNEEKPCLLVIGGSLGAQSINQCIRESLDQLTQQVQVIHLCGKGKIDSSLLDYKGYVQFEYVNEELADLFAISNVVISRAGANSLYELLALGKPHLLVPLSAKVSRGDQIQNARYFAGLGISKVIQDQDFNTESLLRALADIMTNSAEIEATIKRLKITSATKQIIAIIKEQAHVESPRTA